MIQSLTQQPAASFGG